MVEVPPEFESPGNPAGFIADAVARGVGPTQAFREFGEAGGAIRTQTFFRLYGEVNDAIARSPLQSALDPYALPSAQDYTEWMLGSGGQYATQLRVFFTEVGTGITGSKQYLYKTDLPHTPAEAILAAQNDYFSPDNTEIGQSGEGQVFQGAVIDNIYATIPWEG